MKNLWNEFYRAFKETPKMYFAPLIWLWKKLRGTDLNRCSKCGGKAKLQKHLWEDIYRVECQDCGFASKSSCVKEVARLYWNEFK